LTVNAIRVTVYYEYTEDLNDGDIAAEGKVYSSSVYSTNEVGDVAEYFDVEPSGNAIIEPGKLVSFNPGSDVTFKLSERPYDQHLAGVVSQEPSVVLNTPEHGGTAVALTGRVSIRVDGQGIQSGDFLTSSAKAGYAQKATRPGPVIGYAISDQKPGSETVEVLLQPGRFYYPDGEIREEEVSDNADEQDGSGQPAYESASPPEWAR
jgi:hypothetical protein